MIFNLCGSLINDRCDRLINSSYNASKRTLSQPRHGDPDPKAALQPAKADREGQGTGDSHHQACNHSLKVGLRKPNTQDTLTKLATTQRERRVHTDDGGTPENPVQAVQPLTQTKP